MPVGAYRPCGSTAGSAGSQSHSRAAAFQAVLLETRRAGARPAVPAHNRTPMRLLFRQSCSKPVVREHGRQCRLTIALPCGCSSGRLTRNPSCGSTAGVVSPCISPAKMRPCFPPEGNKIKKISISFCQNHRKSLICFNHRIANISILSHIKRSSIQWHVSQIPKFCPCKGGFL